MRDYHVILFLGRLIGPTYYIERFIDYAEKHHIDYYVVDVNEEKSYNCVAFEKYASQENTIMLTFNNIGVHLMAENGSNYWKYKCIPVFDCIQDHPRNFDDTLLEPPCDLYAVTLDRDHEDYIHRYYKKLKGVFFSPNGGTEVNSSIPYEERKIDVIYMGDCQKKIYEYPRIDYFGDCGADFFAQCIGSLVAHTMWSTEYVIDRYFADKKIDVSEEILFKLKNEYSGLIEATVRRYYKLEGMKALDNMGIHVDIWGADTWLDEEYSFSDNIVLHDRIGRHELMEILGNAKISLCFIPWFKKGCSEKNFDSMLNGTLCVTDRSEYLDNHYVDGNNIVYFDLNNPSQMAADVKWLLDHPREASKIADNGYKTAKKYDTWDKRYDYIWSVITRIV